MSFDLGLFRLRDGDACPADKEIVLAIIRRFGASARGPHGHYDFAFADGSSTEFHAGELETGEPFTGGMFHMRCFSQTEFELIHELATKADLVAFNLQGRGTAEEPSVICFDPTQIAHLPQGYAENPVIAASVEELARYLGVSTDRWGRYRDQVIDRRD